MYRFVTKFSILRYYDKVTVTVPNGIRSTTTTHVDLQYLTGNYFRAKRAQERQRQRRLAKQAVAQQKQIYTNSASSGYVAHRNNVGPASPTSSAYTSQEVEMNQGYEPPVSVT